MLSRVAERVYWQSRYLERAENTARLLSVFSTLLMDLPPRTKLGWQSLLEITGTDALFAKSERQVIERNVMRFLLVEENSVSLLNMLAMARENARTTREIMPTEAFEEINNLYWFAREKLGKGVSRGPRHELLEEIIASCQHLAGMLSGTMSHNDAFNFVRLGQYLERADMTTRIVDVGSGKLLSSMELDSSANAEPFENILWMNILRSISAYQMYRQHVKNRVNAEDVVVYLLQDEEFPRSVAYCFDKMENVVKKLPNNEKAVAQISKTLRLANRTGIGKLLESGLFQYIDDMQVQFASVHQKIAETWFLPNK